MANRAGSVRLRQSCRGRIVHATRVRVAGCERRWCIPAPDRFAPTLGSLAPVHGAGISVVTDSGRGQVFTSALVLEVVGTGIAVVAGVLGWLVGVFPRTSRIGLVLTRSHGLVAPVDRARVVVVAH